MLCFTVVVHVLRLLVIVGAERSVQCVLFERTTESERGSVRRLYHDFHIFAIRKALCNTHKFARPQSDRNPLVLYSSTARGTSVKPSAATGTIVNFSYY